MSLDPADLGQLPFRCRTRHGGSTWEGKPETKNLPEGLILADYVTGVRTQVRGNTYEGLLLGDLIATKNYTSKTEGLTLGDIISWTLQVQLTEGVKFGDTEEASATISILDDTIIFGDNYQADVKLTHTEGIFLRDRPSNVGQSLIREKIRITDNVVVKVTAQLVEALVLADSNTVRYVFNLTEGVKLGTTDRIIHELAVSEGIIAGDITQRVTLKTLTEGLVTGESTNAPTTKTFQTEGIILTDIRQPTIQVTIGETVIFADDNPVEQIIEASLSEGFTLGDHQENANMCYLTESLRISDLTDLARVEWTDQSGDSFDRYGPDTGFSDGFGFRELRIST